MTAIPLTRRPGGVRAYKLLLSVGWPGRDLEQQTHEGYEWIYVLDGRLRLRLAEQDVVLAAGEAAEFDTRTPHVLANANDNMTELLALFGPPG